MSHDNQQVISQLSTFLDNAVIYLAFVSAYLVALSFKLLFPRNYNVMEYYLALLYWTAQFSVLITLLIACGSYTFFLAVTIISLGQLYGTVALARMHPQLSLWSRLWRCAVVMLLQMLISTLAFTLVITVFTTYLRYTSSAL